VRTSLQSLVSLFARLRSSISTWRSKTRDLTSSSDRGFLCRSLMILSQWAISSLSALLFVSNWSACSEEDERSLLELVTRAWRVMMDCLALLSSYILGSSQ
jgi:hypothetical protein